MMMVFSYNMTLIEKKNCLANYYQTGQFKFPNLIPTPRGFDNKLTVVEEDEKHMFMRFISRILRWSPEERATAEELLSDPWLQI